MMINNVDNKGGAILERQNLRGAKFGVESSLQKDANDRLGHFVIQVLGQ